MLRLSAHSELSATLYAYPVLRTLLSPAITARRLWLARQRARRRAVYQRLEELLVEDPVIHVGEFDGAFAVDVRSDLFARQLLDDSHEQTLAFWCRRFVQPHRDAIDVGANVGFYSVLFAKLIAQDRKVLAIEPVWRAVRRLRTNLKRNAVDHRVIVYEGVASNHTGIQELHAVDGKDEYSTLGSVRHPSAAHMPYRTVPVQSSTLDELVAAHELRPSVIKIDVEGAERSVIVGCTQVLDRERPILISELAAPLLTDHGVTVKQVIQDILDHDYIVTDPLFPKLKAGTRVFGDILCIPKERA